MKQPLFFTPVAACLILAGCAPTKVAPPPASNVSASNAKPAEAPETSSATQTPPPPGSVTTDYAAAKRQVEETIAKDPKNHNLRMQAAEFYMKTSHYADAVPHLQNATRLAPDKPLAWIALGDAASLSGQFPLAKQAYDRAALKDPHNPFICRGRGQMLILQRKFQEARQVLADGLKTNPSDIEIRTALANLYLILNRPRDTIAALKPVLSQIADRPDLHFMLGEAYERDLHIEAAISEMETATRLDPANAQAWGRIGLYQINLTRYQEAREPLQRAIKITPNESHYYWALGDSYLLENTSEANFQEAQRLYKKALELDPKNDKALYSYGMGLTRHGQPQDLEEAIGIFQRLIALHPADMNAHYKLYETYRRLGRNQEAEAYRAKFKDLFAKGRNQTRSLYAAAAFKDTAEAHLTLGRKAVAQKNYPLAVTEFQMALERDRSLDAARKELLEAQKHLPSAAKAGAP